MSLKLWDFKCTHCEEITEDIVESGVYHTDCKHCGSKAERIFTPSGVHTANQDADWIRSVTEVVDKDNPARHVQEFLRNPTRTNYKNYMKKEGLRHLESGEDRIAREYRRLKDENHVKEMTEMVCKYRQKNNRIEI